MVSMLSRKSWCLYTIRSGMRAAAPNVTREHSWGLGVNAVLIFDCRFLLDNALSTCAKGEIAGWGLKNAHPAPESSQSPGLSMGRRLFVPILLAAQSIGGNQWWKGISSYL